MPTILSLADATVIALRERATKLGVPYSALADVAIANALEKIPDPMLLQWVEHRLATRARAKAPNTAESKVLAAMRRMVETEGGGWRWSLLTVSRESGMRPTVAYQTLKSLVSRGRVRGEELPEVDRWGLPKTSFWTLLDASGQVVKGA